MSNQDLYIRNPLVRDGSSQLRRFIKALDPATVSLDGRTRQEFINFAREYASVVQYYNQNNVADGDWQPFFNDATREQDPHLALFLAFVNILGIAQEELNGITARHLDFFYQQVLGISPKAAVPAQAHILFTLAKNQSDHRVPAGTLLSAGKDSNKTPIYFATDKEIIVNKVGVAALKSAYIDNQDGHQQLFASPVANSADGLGKELPEEEAYWAPFGESQQGLSSDEQSMPGGKWGFALSSPILLLQEGTRNINLLLTVDRKDGLPSSLKKDPPAEEPIEAPISLTETEAVKKIVPEGPGDFLVSFSGEKGWIGPFEASALVTSSSTLELDISVDESYPPIVGFSAEAFEEQFDTTHPLVQVTVNPAAKDLKLHVLRELQIQQVGIEVAVTGVRNLILQNDQSLLDPAKPFMPFGTVPGIGSSFYLGSQEVFSKQLTSFKANVEWFKIPENLGNHYSAYTDGISNGSFKANFSILQNRTWAPLTMTPVSPATQTEGVEGALFDDTNAAKPISYRLQPKEGVTVNRVVNGEPFTQYEPASQYGFVRMELAGYQDEDQEMLAFGHSYFPRLYTEKIILKTVGDENGPQPNTSLPKDPYTPAIKSISLDYTAQVSFPVRFTSANRGSQEAFDNRVERFFHVAPFGECEQHPFTFQNNETSGIPLLPWFGSKGTFFLGLDNYDPTNSQQVSLLFQIAEGTADPAVVGYVAVNWFALVNNQWIPLRKDQVVSDSTRVLIRSGIITFELPKELNQDNTLLPAGQYWLKAELSQLNTGEENPPEIVDLTKGVGRFINLHSQVVTATFSDQGNAQELFAAPLPAGSITKMLIKDAAIKGIAQPYATFGGKQEEASNQYYTRVSERLRHKNRSINIWDYEHMVLEEFPDIYKVKCLNHSSSTHSLSPGHVTLVVIPNLLNREEEQKFRPQASINTLRDITDYLKGLISPFVRLEVINPVFEEIRLRFKVTFREGFDQGFYLKQIQQDIKRYLTPWAYAQGSDIAFEGQIYASTLLDFVEELEYVDFLSCFYMDHIYEQEGKLAYQTTDVATVRTAASILVTAEEHLIELIEFGDCSCDEDDNVIPPLEGIGAMIIGSDFEVFPEPNNNA